MIAEFQKHWQEEYKIQTSEQLQSLLQSVIDKRKTRNEKKNAQTQRDRNTTDDMDETRADGDDDDEGYSEDDHGEDEDGTGSAGDGTASHFKRRQALSFYFTTGAVKRMESNEDLSCHVSPDVS
jgi:cytochrome P450